jgi:hypothetical protein
MTSRRKFIASASLLTLGATTTPAMSQEIKKEGNLTHHVFFWLNHPESKEDRDELIKGLQTLKEIETVRSLYIGIPAETTQRDVIDSSYSVSELIFFNDVAGQNGYQDHPIHHKFIEACAHLWKKVVVYDSVTV